MKKLFFLSLLLSCVLQGAMGQTLKEAFGDKLLIGSCLTTPQLEEKNSPTLRVLNEQFNAVVAENSMKSMYLQPKEGKFRFKEADRFVNYANAQGLKVTGHVLIWHSQCCPWFFTDKQGRKVTPEVLKKRMKSHIFRVMRHFKGRVIGWDVVNEAIMEDGSYRKSGFYEILGEEYIPLAFQYAHEADPDAELYINDYNEWYPEKRKTVLKIINDIRRRGLRIDAVGLQGHIDMYSPTIEQYQATIDDYTKAGVKVMFTEMEISALPQPGDVLSANVSDKAAYKKELDPYTGGLPEKVQQQWNKRLEDIFRLILKNREHFKRVTFWGISDKYSWKNDYPVPGRTDYPLLFDRNFERKPVVDKIVKMAR